MSDVALALIQTGQTKPEQVNNKGNTALLYACIFNMSDVALALIQTGQSKPEHVNDNGKNALYFAKQNKMHLVVSKLTPSSPPVATDYSTVTPVESLDPSDKQLDANAVGHDCIEFDEDVNILTSLTTDKKNIAFLFGTHYFVSNKDIIAEAVLDPAKIKYKCPTVGSMSGIIRTVPYLNMKSIGIMIGLVPLNELKYCVTTESVQLVEIDDSRFEELPSTASLQVLMPGASYVGASHCQEGQGERAFHLKLMTLLSGGRKGGGRKSKGRKSKGRKTKHSRSHSRSRHRQTFTKKKKRNTHTIYKK